MGNDPLFILRGRILEAIDAEASRLGVDLEKAQNEVLFVLCGTVLFGSGKERLNDIVKTAIERYDSHNRATR